MKTVTGETSEVDKKPVLRSPSVEQNHHIEVGLAGVFKWIINRPDSVMCTDYPTQMTCHPKYNVLAILPLFVLAIAGCSRSYEFSGVVLDGNGEPISGATFALAPHGQNEPGRTDPDVVSKVDGTFVTGWCCVPNSSYFVLTTSCTGYIDDVQIVTADATKLRVVLARDLTDNEALDMRDLPAAGTRILLDEGKVRFVPDTQDDG